MKAFESIGWRKSLRFLYYELMLQLSRICIVPQLRVLLLRFLGATIGADTVMMNITFDNVYHYGFTRLFIGSRCYIGTGATIDVRGGVQIQDDVTISGGVTIVSHLNVGYHSHPLARAFPLKEARVRLGRGSYIGTGAIILPGVTIGAASVIGAGAVVTRDIPTRVVAVGVPAKIVRRIRGSSIQQSRYAVSEEDRSSREA